MMKILHSSLSFLITIFFVNLSGQPIDLEANALLKDVSDKISNFESIEITFEYSIINDTQDLQQRTDGKIVVKNDMFSLDIFEIRQIFDGEQLYTISNEDEEITISKQQGYEFNYFSPSSLLNSLKKSYSCKMDIVQKKSGSTIQYIKFLPLDSNSEIKYILVGVDNKTKIIDNLVMFDENKIKTVIKIKEFNTNKSFPKSYFKFEKSKYKGYYINNLD